VLGAEAANPNFKVFGLNLAMLEAKINRTRLEHANHYTTDEVGHVFGSRMKSKLINMHITFILAI
jgi:hypothetical protein